MRLPEERILALLDFAISSFDSGHPNVIVFIPTSFPTILGDLVFGVGFPGPNGFLGGPVGNGEAKPAGITDTLDAKEPRLLSGQLNHAPGHVVVAMISG